MESIALLREEANEVAKLAAKQTNTILPERDDSKPQGGFGYTAVQVGIHNSVFGLVPNSHLKLIKRDRLPNIQLIFLYGSLSIPTYIDHYYDCVCITVCVCVFLLASFLRVDIYNRGEKKVKIIQKKCQQLQD